MSSQYVTRLERKFRQLEKYKWPLCHAIHCWVHQNTEPPPKPSVQFMRNEVYKAYPKFKEKAKR